MKIFVIIVTYNGSRWLNDCLGSLRRSAVPLLPVVVDNCSSDNTVDEIESRFPEVVLLKSKVNLGFGKANNLGIEYAMQHGADYLFLLNQDAYVFPHTVGSLVAISRRYPEYLVLSPLHLDGTEQRFDYNFSLWTGADKCPGLQSDLALKKDSLQDVYEAEFINAALWLLPRKTIETIGGFDPLFSHYGEDNNFVNRVRYHGYKIGVCPSAHAVHNRPQAAFDWSRLTPRQAITRRRIAYLITLTDLNQPLAVGFAKMANEWIKLLVKTALSLSPVALVRCFRTLLGMVFFMPRLFKSRRLSKQKSRNFLDQSVVTPTAIVNNRQWPAMAQ